MKTEKQKYKKTELGLIPEDWQIFPFGEVFEFISSYAVSRENLVKIQTKNKIQNIHYGDIHAKFINEILDLSIDEELPFIKDEIVNGNNFSFLKDGDLVIADVSEDYEGVGECIELKNVGDKKIVGGLHTFVARSINGKTANGFRCYILRNPKVRLNLKILATGSKVYGVSKTNLSKLKIIVPPLPEQKKIAATLSTWDKAIEDMQRLIKIKERTKKGFEKKLLNGSFRFKEFKKMAWDEIPLSEAAWYQEGPGLRKWQFKKQGIKVINITNIVDGVLDLSLTDRHISKDEFKKTYKHFEVDAGDIVVASSGNSYCKHGIVRECDLPLVMNTSVIRFKPKENCEYEFLNQFLKSSYFKEQIDILITGGAQPNFGPAHLAEIFIPLPEKGEQKKISFILSSYDKEIKALKLKLEKLKEQKKGLMQVLLTGKKRVKI